jgi:hypothetical protein
MAIETVNSSSSLAEVIDRILDKGVVIDVWVRVSLVGIELLVVEARIVLASVETYLRYAEAVGLTGQAAIPRVRGSVPGVPAASGLSGLSGLTGVSGVQDYVSSTTPLPSTGSYATGVSPSQPSTANPTDIVGGIEL